MECIPCAANAPPATAGAAMNTAGSAGADGAFTVALLTALDAAAEASVVVEPRGATVGLEESGAAEVGGTEAVEHRSDPRDALTALPPIDGPAPAVVPTPTPPTSAPPSPTWRVITAASATTIPGAEGAGASAREATVGHEPADAIEASGAAAASAATRPAPSGEVTALMPRPVRDASMPPISTVPAEAPHQATEEVAFTETATAERGPSQASPQRAPSPGRSSLALPDAATPGRETTHEPIGAAPRPPETAPDDREGPSRSLLSLLDIAI